MNKTRSLFITASQPGRQGGYIQNSTPRWKRNANCEVNGQVSEKWKHCAKLRAWCSLQERRDLAEEKNIPGVPCLLHRPLGGV